MTHTHTHASDLARNVDVEKRRAWRCGRGRLQPAEEKKKEDEKKKAVRRALGHYIIYQSRYRAPRSTIYPKGDKVEEEEEAEKRAS